MKFTVFQLVFIVITALGCSMNNTSGHRNFGGKEEIAEFDIYLDEDGQEISRKKFIKDNDFRTNLDAYYEKNETKYAALIRRKNVDSLDYRTFVSALSSSLSLEIEDDRPLMIFYFREVAIKEPSLQYYYKRTKGWAENDPDYRYFTILHKDYSPALVDTLDLKRYDLHIDRDDIMSKFIDPYGSADNHSFMIRQDGRYKYYIGEGGMGEVAQDWGIGW